MYKPSSSGVVYPCFVPAFCCWGLPLARLRRLKVAIINSQAAVIETAEIKKAQTELEAKYKPRQTQIESPAEGNRRSYRAASGGAG